MKQTFYLILFSTIIAFTSCTKKKGDADVLEQITCDAEQRTADSSMFISNSKLNAGLFNAGRQMSIEKAKSGKNSIKLTGDAEFGFTYVIDKVETGDMFQVEVWRGGAISGQLVVSGEKSEEFYAQNNKSIETDENGWEKILIDVVVPVALNGKTLKVYVWNADKTKIVYFDDLKISYLGKKQ